MRHVVLSAVVFAGLAPSAWAQENLPASAHWTLDDTTHGPVLSGAVSMSPGTPYVLEGRIKSPHGSGWLEITVVDPSGRERSWKTPRVQRRDDWTYVAVEVPAQPLGQPPCTAQVAIGARGSVYADDISFVPNAAMDVINGDFQLPLDKKGRVPYWNEDTDKATVKGTSGGTYGLAAEPGIDGSSTLELKATNDWFAFTSINYPVEAGTKAISFSARAQTNPEAKIRQGIAWSDSDQEPVRVDWQEAVESASWLLLNIGPVEPPAGAQTVRPVIAVVKKNRAPGDAVARIDDVHMQIVPAPSILVTVNQVGYELDGPKSAVVQTRVFPARRAVGSMEVLDASGRVVLEKPLTCAGRMRGEKGADWGWYFWRGDFSELNTEGEYRVRARIGKHESTSHPFQIARDRLFTETADANVDFFFVQRCGFDVPGWHAACHLDCAKMPDGTHRDLTGGWHSAGDYNKLQWEYGDGGVMYALLTAYESDPASFESKNRDGAALCDILDEAWWGAQYLAKVQAPDTGGILNHIEQGPDRSTWMKWCPPETMTDNVAGTPDDPIVKEGLGNSPLAIGGWARLARLLDAKQIANDYLERASRLWSQATANGTGNADPLLLISSLDLHRVNGDAAVLQYAQRSADALLTGSLPDGGLPGGYSESGDVPAAALAYFALARPDDPLASRIRERLVQHTDPFLAEATNAIGLYMEKRGEDGYYFEPTSALGCNYMGNCRAWSALMVYRVTHDARLLQYAMDQLDFLLGRNPYGICMMEGEGAVNLPRYHHRYLTIPGHETGAVPGAIPNGFVRDMAANDRPGVDLSTGGRQYPSYRTNEPWLVHNVFYTLAITALHEAL